MAFDRVGAVCILVACAAGTWLASGDELDRDFNLWLLVVPIVLIPTAIVAVVLLTVLTFSLAWRQWTRAASILLAPVIGALSFHAVLHGAVYDRVRLEWNRSRYLEDVARSPAPPGSHVNAWQVGATGGVAVDQVFYFVVFDESDTIARPRLDWSEAWKAQARAAGPASLDMTSFETSIVVRGLRDHFYLVIQTY